MPTIVVVSSAETPTSDAWCTCAASTNCVADTLVPRSMTSMLAPFHIMPTRFLPMSWRSPWTVPMTAVWAGLIPALTKSGSSSTSASFIARALTSISGT